MGVEKREVVADLPFLTVQVSREETMRNAGRLMKEAGVQAVKLEGETRCRDHSRVGRCRHPGHGPSRLTPPISPCIRRL